MKYHSLFVFLTIVSKARQPPAGMPDVEFRVQNRKRKEKSSNFVKTTWLTKNLTYKSVLNQSAKFKTHFKACIKWLITAGKKMLLILPQC